MSRARRGKGKSRGGGQRQNGGTHEVDEAIKEVFQNFQMLNEVADDPNQYQETEDNHFESFIVSKHWVAKMDDHVRGKAPFPEEVVNCDLLDEHRHNKRDRVFQWGPKRKHYNAILRRNLKYKRDFLICSQASWETLTESGFFEVCEIKKKFKAEKKGFSPVNSDYDVVQMVCVNSCEEVEELEDYLRLMHVQYNSDDSFEYVVDYVECTELSTDSDDRTSLYKVDNRLSGEEFLEDLKLQIDSYKIDKHERDETKRPEFRLRGYKMEHTREEMKEMYMCDVFLPRSTLLVVKNPKKQPFKLVAELPGLQDSPEICEECDEKKLLTIECGCKRAFYCSVGCRIKNLSYHRSHCKEASHIQPLLDLRQDYLPLPAPQLRHGLTNMGNTCYLNAVFSVLRHYPPFYEYIRQMDEKKMQQVNEAGLNIFPFVYDAFMRMNFQPLDCAFSPYLLKGAIGLKNESFIKFNQNDSMEFLQMFLEILNKDAEEAGEQVVLEEKMKGGVTFNFVECKDCGSQAKHEEHWSSLCVTIPDYVPLKKIQIEYLPLRLTDAKDSLIFSFNKDLDTVLTCLQHLALLKQADPKRLVLCFTKCEEVGLILNEQPNLLFNEAFELLNSAKFSGFRLVCFEVVVDLQPDEDIRFDQFVPVLLKFDKMSNSINEFMKQEVKTGCLSLVLLPAAADDRCFYQSLAQLFLEHTGDSYFTGYTLGDLDKNLAKKVAQSEPEAKKTEPQAKVNPDSKSHKSPPRQKPQEPEEKSKTPHNPRNKKGHTSKQPGYNPSQSQPTRDSKPKEPEKPQQKPSQEEPKSKPLPEEAAAPGAEAQPQEPPLEITMRDLIFESVFGLNGKNPQALFEQVEADEADKEYLKSLGASGVTARFSNPVKSKCPHCGKPGFHKCSLASSNRQSLSKLFKLLREGKILDAPAVAVTVSVLVQDEALLELMSRRNVIEHAVATFTQSVSVDLTYCLEKMQQKEDMGQDSKVDCSTCGTKTERQVCYVIERAPEFFLIQLKRFKTEYNYSNNKTDKKKNRMMVQLPERLTLREQEFALFGVVNHYGEIDSGHYTAHLKASEAQGWLLFDDEKVSAASFKDVNKEAAYLLFYLEVGPKASIN